MPTEYDRLRKLVADSPRADAPIAVLADWLDHAGRHEEAAAWRWLGVFRRRPGSLLMVGAAERTLWGWRRVPEDAGPAWTIDYGFMSLPAKLFDQLPGLYHHQLWIESGAGIKLHTSAARAVDALVNGFIEATKPRRGFLGRRRAPLWSPDWSLARFVPEFPANYSPALDVLPRVTGDFQSLPDELAERIAAAALLGREQDPRRTATPRHHVK